MSDVKNIRKEVQKLIWSGVDRQEVMHRLMAKYQYYDDEIQNLIAFTPSKQDKEKISGLNDVLFFAILFFCGCHIINYTVSLFQLIDFHIAIFVALIETILVPVAGISMAISIKNYSAAVHRFVALAGFAYPLYYFARNFEHMAGFNTMTWVFVIVWMSSSIVSGIIALKIAISVFPHLSFKGVTMDGGKIVLGPEQMSDNPFH